jgi:hypothetical protein
VYVTKQILYEELRPGTFPINTGKEEDGFVYLKGLFIQGDVRNHNGRIYPRDEISRAVDSVNQRINELKQKTGNPKACIAGELDHPEGLNINFKDISHGITEMHLNGADGYGTMRVMNEGNGLIAKSAIDIGIPVGVSSRGSGNVGSDGRVSDFEIVTIDLVINPSAPDAFPKVSLSEALMKTRHGREYNKLTEAARFDHSAQKYLRETIMKALLEIKEKI